MIDILGYNPNQNLFCCSNTLVLAVRSRFSRLPSVWACLFSFNSSLLLALQGALGSFYSAPALDSAISPGSPSAFYWGMGLEPRIWVMVCTWLPECCFFEVLSSDSEEIRVCTLTHVDPRIINICVRSAVTALG